MAKKRKLEVNGFDVRLVPEEREDVSDAIWNGEWTIFRTRKKEAPLKVGNFKFKGEPKLGHLEIEISIDHDYINNGYATAALKTISDWCFARSNIFVVDAYIETDNVPALRAFTAAGFVYRTKEKGIEHYSILKPQNAWLGLYIVIGVWAGLILGVVLNSPTIGFCIGLVIGLLCGKVMEVKEKNRREEILGTSTRGKK